MARTYIENEVVPHIPAEYTEENLRLKFIKRQDELWNEIESNLEHYNSLKDIEKGTNWDEGSSAYRSYEDLKKDLALLRSQTNNSRNEAETIQQEAKLLQKYGQAFANLYYIKEQHEMKGFDEKLSFTEVDITGNGDIITDSQHYGMSFNPEGKLSQPALVVKINDDLEFNIGMMEFNKPNSAPEVKLQISFDEETAENLDAEKLGAIFDFCEKYGISSSDMIVRRFDGSIDEKAIQEKLDNLVAEHAAKKAEQEAKAAREEYDQQKHRGKELINEAHQVMEDNGGKLPLELTEAGISNDLPLEDSIIKAENKTSQKAKGAIKPEQLNEKTVDDLPTEGVYESTASTTQQLNSTTVPQQSAPANSSKLKASKVEQKFEKFFEEGLAKRRDLSYFKTSTSLLGNGWTEYILYDTEDKQNRRKDAVVDKNGNVKYNYTLKFFIREDSDGNIHFAYRTPYHKPINEDILGGIVGQLKDLGFTHVNFPSAIPDKEKGMWRKALAEKGLVPIGISLDRSKAEGMIKAAKEKLSSEELSRFKYRLAIQMDRHNKQKGKKVDKSEQDFIDSLILAHKYETFSTGYSEVLKGKITRLVHPKQSEEKENGAVGKIAAMVTLRRLFDAFKDGVESGSVLNSEVLTEKEKDYIRNSPDLMGNPSKFNGGQFADLYDILFKHSYDYSHTELEKRFFEPGAKRADEAIKQGEFNAAYNSCKSIIKELKALGAEEIDLPESTSKLPYIAPIRKNDKTATTSTQTKPNTNNNPGPVAAAHSFERSDR